MNHEQTDIMGVSTFNEMSFPIEFYTIIMVILTINGFATIFIVEFDPTIAEVGNVVVGR
jgi:hypothetical protein